ncbi:ostricacin-2-like [Apteryx mantelli]|uniref:Ostricacin-2-like n=1 Tax=Apteryx mantelli TaxID=2696672 RepID=A0ABM4EE25_9AVES
MRILCLLFPFFLLLLQGAAGFSFAPGSKKECERIKGYCSFSNCYFPYVAKGVCSRFSICCKK